MFAATVRHVLKDDQYGDEPYIVTPFAMIGMSVPLVLGENICTLMSLVTHSEHRHCIILEPYQVHLQVSRWTS